MEDIKLIFAQNLITLRKSNKLTQIELATKLNYSDKAISKWERGDALPDVSTLLNIAQLFSVTIDYLVTEHTHSEDTEIITNNILAIRRRNKLSITFITIFSILVLQTILFVILQSNYVNTTVKLILYCYVYPLPITFLVLIVLSSIWWKRIFTFIFVAIFVWCVLLDVFLLINVFTHFHIAYLFVVGVLAEVITYLGFNIKHTKQK